MKLLPYCAVTEHILHANEKLLLCHVHYSHGATWRFEQDFQSPTVWQKMNIEIYPIYGVKT